MLSHNGGAVEDDDGTTPFSERDEIYDSKFNDEDDEEVSREDFLCVPASNIENDM